MRHSSRSSTATISPIRAGSARYLGSNNDLTGVQPNLNKTVFMDWTQGSNAVPGELGLDGFFASKNYVKDHHLSLGSPVTLQFPSGKKTTVKLKGVWDEPKGGSPFAHITISTVLFEPSSSAHSASPRCSSIRRTDIGTPSSPHVMQ